MLEVFYLKTKVGCYAMHFGGAVQKMRKKIPPLETEYIVSNLLLNIMNVL